MLKRIIKSYDYPLIIAVCLLCLFGLVMVYSSSMVLAATKFSNPTFFFDRQKFSLILGFLGFLATMAFPYKAYSYTKLLIAMALFSIGMLVIVYTFGHTANNAQSWLMLGTRGIQPSEFSKLSVIIYLAAVYAKKQSYIDQFDKAVMPPILFTLIICGFVAIQPDIGTAFIIGMIAVTIILCSGMGGKTLTKLALLAMIGIGISSPIIMMQYDKVFTEERMSRFHGFIDPFETEEDAGYQLVNSYIALGSGGFTGLGLGQSVQKFGYLPEAHTDFIMAVIAEELGVVGVLFVLLLLLFIILRGFMIARKCEDPFGSLLAIGISSMLAIQAFINLGGLTGIIPITGVTLPFISYGGSSLILLLLSMGILVNVSMFVNYHDNYSQKTKEKVQYTEPRFASKYSSH
ncbi:putative lipid II flippase FtsW [Litchfieldia salsa]|uniref:Probable peptidoglycan glycosyltransferase FtsW n=1 Tax=Litchfieldia salsa TaxID=930152 RepID=A0A1H0RHW1_9BACI|nr:putative lipid II flippase FtsW [Litchfieldia salsa]SDP28990.1 cell division-specific peptidoglycan biosynthesis regulator FtsW [Litchfieldia salsa]